MPSQPNRSDVPGDGRGFGAARVVPPAGAFELTAYRALTRIARPAASLILRMRERRGKEDPGRKSERLGRAGLARPEGPLVWVHAASVGEANSVQPLVAALGERRPGLTVLLTTGTVTSARAIGPRLPAHAIHQYVPLDAPQLVARFLDHWRPDLAVFTEQEIWPNLIVETGSRGVPLALVNGRMSEASFERWQKRPRLARALFGRFGTVLAQSQVFAERFASLGAGGARSTGNLKIDAPALPVDTGALAALDTALAGRPHFIAASTHDGEERIIAAAHRTLRDQLEGFVTIIAPRHPERGPSLAETMRAEGFVVAQRSRGELPGAHTEIYVADTIGELGTLYAASPVAFIGGSLIDHGGQNPIEAVRHGAAVLTGPSWHNFEDAYEALLAKGGAVEVSMAAEIAEQVAALLTDEQRLGTSRRNASAALAELAGALERTLEVLLPLVPEIGHAGIGHAETGRAATGDVARAS